MDILEEYVRFVKETEGLKSVLRSAVTASGRQESTAEHSFRLALFAAVMAGEFPEMNRERLLLMSLLHDMGELYDGDIPANAGADPEEKHRSEREAVRRVFGLLPEGLAAEFTGLWEEYNGCLSPEAKLVKALDKAETIIQHNQGANAPDFDYDFNLEYGKEYFAFSPLLSRLRQGLDEETARRMEEGASGRGDVPTEETAASRRDEPAEKSALSRGEAQMEERAQCRGEARMGEEDRGVSEGEKQRETAWGAAGMRRGDREIKEIPRLMKVMESCDVCRLALNGGTYPYIVPLNFGMEMRDGRFVLYFHGALEGRKLDLIAADPHAAFEMDCTHGLVMDAERGNCAMEYESIAGCGTVELVGDEEKKHGLDVLMAHYHKEDFPYNEAVIPRTAVFKLTVESLSGKARKRELS